ncbi:hypothetical protein N7466_008166 [Penicillium verhagenii]|uniref:uncharacterized protein n=1 Tax=Penicillium verhagenii TaxID=1562060 RepID=UPI0025453518|nr:uncharacterized protein N7466_008166 [Penicillium verhagenii]KAJ5923979.1 hypothetical protein N7466_008166 [Penicillium verhagenii]
MLVQAARLFNENNGVWGSSQIGPLSARRLREQYLPTSTDQSRSFYIRVTIDGNLLGIPFACRWIRKVVDQYHRDKGLASGLLGMLKQDHNDIYGVMSSHPAACLVATANTSGSEPRTKTSWRDTDLEETIEKIDLDFHWQES